MSLCVSAQSNGYLALLAVVAAFVKSTLALVIEKGQFPVIATKDH